MGTPTVDMFSSALNTRCDRCFWNHCAPRCEFIDAFSVPCGGPENRWIYPSLSDALRLLHKILADLATATVILSEWQEQA